MKMMTHSGFLPIVAMLPLIFLGNNSSYQTNALKESETDEAEELKVICKGPRRLLVVCANPPKIAGDYYHVIVKETEDSNSEPKVEHSSSRGFISIEFKDLRPFTNYTITVNDFQHGVQVPVATAFAHTYPEAPDPVLSPSSTTESITIKFTRGEDERPGIFSYFATGYKGGYSLESEQISGQCNQLANECTFEHLSPNTGYEFEFFRCSTAKPTLCSSPSQRRGQFYTLPETPIPNYISTMPGKTFIFYRRDNSMKTAKYTALATPIGKNRRDSVEVECEKEICYFGGLSASTAYELRIRACINDPRSYRCSDWSPPEKIHTSPDKPRDVVVTNYTVDSITVAWKPPASNAESISFYQIMAFNKKVRKVVTVSNQEVNGTVEGLKPFGQYRVRVSACVRTDYCGAAGSIHAFTAPEEPTNVTVSKYNESSLLITWQPPKQNSELITQYRITISTWGDSRSPTYVSGTTTAAVINNVRRRAKYRIEVSACARVDDCGIALETAAWISPKKPRDLRVKPLENRALACEWNTEDDNYEVDAYEIDLFTVNDSQPLQNLTLPAKVHFAMFKDLPSHTEFLVKLRSCFFDEHSESNLCSEPITALALTNPDPAKFEIVERTASSIVFGLIGPVNTSHFNYTLWVSNSTSRVSFDSQNHTFTALALSANSMVTASLVTCCKHNICSTPFKVDAFTKSKDSQFYIAAVLPSFLGFLLLFLFLIAFLFRQRILRLARLMCNKQEKTDMSKSNGLTMEQIPSGSFAIEFRTPLKSQMPTPTEFEQPDPYTEAENT